MKWLAILGLVSWSVVVSGQEKPVSPDKLYSLAEEANDRGDYPLTIAYLNQCLVQRPGYFDAYFMRAGAKEQLKDYDGALTDYSILLEHVPAHREGLLNRGLVRYQLKMYELAREDFQRVLALPLGATQSIYFNRSASIHGTNQIMTVQGKTNPLILDYLGMIDLRLKQYTSAIHWFDSAIQLDGKSPDFYVNRGLAKQSSGDSSGALIDYNRALKINPHHTPALHNLSLLRRSTEAPIDLAIESDSTELQPYLERARQRLVQGDNNGAAADLTRALQLEKDDAEIWFSRGLARERILDFKGAFSDYTRAIDLKEDHFKGWINRANVLLKLQRYQDAIEDYTVALVYHPDFAAAYYNRAIAKNYLREAASACADLQKAESLGMKIEPGIKAQFCKKE